MCPGPSDDRPRWQAVSPQVSSNPLRHLRQSLRQPGCILPTCLGHLRFAASSSALVHAKTAESVWRAVMSQFRVAGPSWPGVMENCQDATSNVSATHPNWELLTLMTSGAPT
jgi:hypothetical protein